MPVGGLWTWVWYAVRTVGGFLDSWWLTDLRGGISASWWHPDSWWLFWRCGWWIADLEFFTKILLVTLPQIPGMGKNLWLWMANGSSHTDEPWSRGKNATFVFAVEIFVQNRSVDT